MAGLGFFSTQRHRTRPS